MCQTFGRFRIEEKLGEGGMGVVYRAFDTGFDRTVAIKILRPDLYASPEVRIRFAHEARAAIMLHHPHIVTVYEVGCEQGLDFICMEYVEGETLEVRIRRRPLGIAESLRCASEMAQAISAAHTTGVVHRDIKPANIIITPDRGIKILDFGLAKFSPGEDISESSATRTMCTQDGQILGTVCYMSPEQAEGRVVDSRSDIFSFGCVLYEMLTAQRAFDGESNLATLAAILREAPKPVREINPAVPRELEKVVIRCLEKNPNRRFDSMKELTAALDTQLCMEPGGLVSTKVRRWFRGAKLLFVLVFGFALMWCTSSWVKPANIYLFCFIVGVGFSAVGALSGSLHLPHLHGIHHGGAGLQGGQGPYGAGSISGLNAGTIAAFVAWFGGTGYVFTRYVGMGLASTYAAAVVGGFAGAGLIFLFVAKVLLAHDQELNPADYDMVGLVGRVSSSIREGGTGEMIFTMAGTRRAAIVRSFERAHIPRGTKVVVIRYQGGIAHVRAADHQGKR